MIIIMHFLLHFCCIDCLYILLEILFYIKFLPAIKLPHVTYQNTSVLCKIKNYQASSEYMEKVQQVHKRTDG